MTENELEEDGTERHVDDSRVHQSFGDELSENLEDLGLDAAMNRSRIEAKVSSSSREGRPTRLFEAKGKREESTHTPTAVTSSISTGLGNNP